MTQTSDDLARLARESQQSPQDSADLPSTHADTSEDTDRKQWIRYSAIAAVLVVGGALLVKFVLNPWLYQYFLDNPLTEAEKREMAVIEKYQINSIEESTKTTGYSKYGSHSVTYYVIDGTMRDCEIDGPTEDPVLTCVGWNPPLRSDAPTGATDPATGIGATDPTTETPDVSVTETTLP